MPKAPEVVLAQPAVPGADARARRSWLRTAPDAEIADWLVDVALAHRPQAQRFGADLAAFLGVPVGEVSASPFGLRACLIGAASGAAVVHHELRNAWRWDPELLADDAVADSAHGSWLDGGLHVGRYEGFCQDLPFAVFDPNHSARWTPHELLHRACGFAWRSAMDRWWLYRAARLGEVLPVAHWYGTDRVMRLDSDRFDREDDARHPGASVADAQWLTCDADELARRARTGAGLMRAAARWVDAELDAVEREGERGDTIAVDDPLLDSVTDAIAYTTGHHRRLAHPLIGRILGHVTAEGRERFTELDAYARHIERVFDELVFGDLQLDSDRAEAMRAGRLLWDLTLRAGLCDPITTAEVLDDRLPALGAVCRAALAGDAQAGTDARAVLLDLATVLTDAGLSEVLPIGVAAALDPLPARPRLQLAEGIHALAPDLASIQLLDDDRSMADLMSERSLFRRAPLVQRLVDAATGDDTLADRPEILAEALLARAIAGSTARDDVTERLSVPPSAWPQALDAARVRRSPAFVRVSVPSLPTDYLVGRYFDAVSVLPCPNCVTALWQLLADGPRDASECIAALQADLATAPSGPDWPASARQWLAELGAAGAIGLLLNS